MLRSQASRREFLGERGHRVRFVFLPKHTSWLNQIEIVFGMIMRKVVRRGNFWGTQFHPERSSATGARVLRNFLAL